MMGEQAVPVSQMVDEVKHLLWGERIQEELFHRWSQGFMFSPDEPTALVQKEGGPCAVIAPVQAYLLRAVMRSPDFSPDNWRYISPERADVFLCQALTEILRQVAHSDLPPPTSPPSTSQKLQAVLDLQKSSGTNMNLNLNKGAADAPQQQQQPVHPPPPTAPQPTSYYILVLNQPLSRRISCEEDNGLHPGVIDERLGKTEEEIFHRNLRLIQLDNLNQVENTVREKLEVFKGYYGILQFLYSVILTKSVAKLKSEMSEASELIDPIHGHGGQSLINLFISGQGVNYVWDHDKDCGGLQLRGIARQCEVGFLTMLERLRYCEVGTFLKNPRFPIWLLGSETHLTVLFSLNENLVKPESPSESARRVFQSFDPDGNNFIQAAMLEDVLRSLGLFADSEYVAIMLKKLDPETLGIILLNDFMDEFFPEQKCNTPDLFTIYHYNGLPLSSSNRKVMYVEGNAIILETDVRSVSDENMILTILQTKWPLIDVQWIGGLKPSVN